MTTLSDHQVAFNLGTWRQGCDRVNDHQVNTARTHQRIGNFQRLLARVRLGNQQIRQVHTQFLSVTNVQSMLSIDKRTSTTQLLHFSNRLQRQCGFTRGFRTINLNYAATWQATDAERDIQA